MVFNHFQNMYDNNNNHIEAALLTHAVFLLITNDLK